MIILALDALDLQQVRRFNCRNLMQKERGQTDLSDFEQARTVVLWASFLTGRNLEAEIPLATQWTYRVTPEETFLKYFRTPKTIDVPAFTYKQKNHEEERRLLKAFFEEKASVAEYDSVIWRNHEENKRDFFTALSNHDLVMGYFNLADAIGHLSFGVAEKMARVYRELDQIAGGVKTPDKDLLIISDHGMKAVGRYGDHSHNGFYSFSRDLGLHLPKITSFHTLLRRIGEG